MTRVLACGGRNYRDQVRVDYALDRVHEVMGITLLIHGAAAGADSLAHDWARRRAVPVSQFPADWDATDHPQARLRWHSKLRKMYDANAGFRRNLRMILEGAPELGVVFPGGPGTDDMHAKMLRAGIPCLQVDPRHEVTLIVNPTYHSEKLI